MRKLGNLEWRAMAENVTFILQFLKSRKILGLLKNQSSINFEKIYFSELFNRFISFWASCSCRTTSANFGDSSSESSHWSETFSDSSLEKVYTRFECKFILLNFWQIFLCVAKHFIKRLELNFQTYLLLKIYVEWMSNTTVSFMIYVMSDTTVSFNISISSIRL